MTVDGRAGAINGRRRSKNMKPKSTESKDDNKGIAIILQYCDLIDSNRFMVSQELILFFDCRIGFILLLKWRCGGATLYRVAIDM